MRTQGLDNYYFRTDEILSGAYRSRSQAQPRSFQRNESSLFRGEHQTVIIIIFGGKTSSSSCSQTRVCVIKFVSCLIILATSSECINTTNLPILGLCTKLHMKMIQGHTVNSKTIHFLDARCESRWIVVNVTITMCKNCNDSNYKWIRCLCLAFESKVTSDSVSI